MDEHRPDHRGVAAVPRSGHDGDQGQGRRRPGGRRRPADRAARGVRRRRVAGAWTPTSATTTARPWRWAASSRRRSAPTGSRSRFRCEDVEGHARLASKLDVPIAAGEMLFGRDEFAAYLDRGALDVVQPDVTRLGGITGLAESGGAGRAARTGRCRRTCCRRSASIWRADCRRWRRWNTCRGCIRCSRRRRGSRTADLCRRRGRGWGWRSIRTRRRSIASWGNERHRPCDPCSVGWFMLGSFHRPHWSTTRGTSFHFGRR